MDKSRLLSAVCASILIVVFVSSAKAAIVYESVTGDFGSNNGGSQLASTSFLGARFTINQQTTLQGIGGYFSDLSYLIDLGLDIGGSIFGALVNLNGSGFPSATELTLDSVIASSVFTPTWGTDFLAPINATLNPGTYGVVLGSGLFGATGSQLLPSIQPGQQTSTSGTIFFSSTTTTNWQDLSENRYRIILSDTAPAVVPIPPALWLFGSGLLGLAGMARRRKLHNR